MTLLGYANGGSMARPRKDSNETPVEERIKQAFWELLTSKPIEDISIGELTMRAGCNRGTFYYYYTDIYDLLARVVNENMPTQLPQIIVGMALEKTEASAVLETAEKTKGSIDKLCVLLNTSAADEVGKQIHETAKLVWRDKLGVDIASPEMEANLNAQILFEFLVSGILGVLAYRGRAGCEPSIANCVDALTPEFPASVMKCLERSGALPKHLSPG